MNLPELIVRQKELPFEDNQKILRMLEGKEDKVDLIFLEDIMTYIKEARESWEEDMNSTNY